MKTFIYTHMAEKDFLDLKFSTFIVQLKQWIGLYAGIYSNLFYVLFWPSRFKY